MKRVAQRRLDQQVAFLKVQVGAHYLLSLLVGGEPRGLRGATLEKVACQRAGEGRFLDDVILHAKDGDGRKAVLEIQVKRGVSFAPSDPLFRSIVGQIVKASQRPEFWTTRYELAIAISRTSHKIDGAYQDLLRWAHQIGDAATFMNQVNRPGAGNKDMRSFVDTFRAHLRDFGAADDDEAIWRLLRRLQILVFDFSAEGSASEALAREWARQVLHPDDAGRAGALWTTLTGLALEIAAAAGDRRRQDLLNDLKNRSFRLAGDLRYATARKALAEASRHALADIGSHVGGISLSRDAGIAAVRAALDAGCYVEIRGDSGVGKSALLKRLAEQIAAEGQVIILSPIRTIAKGWTAMKAALGFDGTARSCLRISRRLAGRRCLWTVLIFTARAKGLRSLTWYARPRQYLDSPWWRRRAAILALARQTGLRTPQPINWVRLKPS